MSQSPSGTSIYIFILANSISDQIYSIGWLQWVSFITGLIYVYYASKNNPLCWPWGIVSSATWAYVSWIDLKLWSDSVLQIIYVFLGIWGWYTWDSKKSQIENTIRRASSYEIAVGLITSFILSFVLGYTMQSTNAAYPMLDAFLTVFSILATLGLVHQKIENWILWIGINFISIPLFIARGGHLFAVLFFIYLILAIKGWTSWSHQMKQKSSI